MKNVFINISSHLNGSASKTSIRHVACQNSSEYMSTFKRASVKKDVFAARWCSYRIYQQGNTGPSNQTLQIQITGRRLKTAPVLYGPGPSPNLLLPSNRCSKNLLNQLKQLLHLKLVHWHSLHRLQPVCSIINSTPTQQLLSRTTTQYFIKCKTKYGVTHKYRKFIFMRFWY